MIGWLIILTANMNEFIKDALTFVHSTIKGECGDGCVTVVCRSHPIETIASCIEELKMDCWYSEKLGREIKIWEKEAYPNAILFSDKSNENLLLIQGLENFDLLGGNALYDNMIVII